MRYLFLCLFSFSLVNPSVANAICRMDEATGNVTCDDSYKTDKLFSTCEDFGSFEPLYSTWGSYYEQPQVGEYCPQSFGYNFDARHCYLKQAPEGTTPFLYNNASYYTPLPGNQCVSPDSFDGANCYVGPLPSSYDAFIYNRSFYTTTNPHIVYKHDPYCPPGSGYDGANCYYGAAPTGKTAIIYNSRWFAFSKSILESCSDVLPGSTRLSLRYCGLRRVPCGFEPFAYNNSWYVKPLADPSGQGHFETKYFTTDSDTDARPICLQNSNPIQWRLRTEAEGGSGDEFNDVPDNTHCYTSSDRLKCVDKMDSSFRTCADSPTNWRASARATWSQDWHNKYDRFVNLNKCIWYVDNSYIHEKNTPDGVPPIPLERYKMENVSVSNGVVTLVTDSQQNHSGPFDCGRDYTDASGWNLTSTDCPFSASQIYSPTLYPYNVGHDHNSSDPESRYTGLVVGPGPSRVEFRLKMNQMGHGGWNGVWLFHDQDPTTTIEWGEYDVLEYIADHQGNPDQIVNQTASYGRAIQSIHDQFDRPVNQPAVTVSDAVHVPISIGEWHTYAVEFDANEVRMYIDGCLRNKMHEGDIYTASNGVPRAFHVPHDQQFRLLIGTAASSADYFPAWGKAYSGDISNPVRVNFVPSIMEVDYVRIYVPQ